MAQASLTGSEMRDDFEREACAALAYLSDTTETAVRLRAFGAIGRYCALVGLDDSVTRALSLPALTAPEELRSLDTGVLDTAAHALLERAPALALQQSDEASTTVLSAVRTRHDIELILLGLYAVQGSRPKLSAEQRASIVAFDALIEPEVWRLVPLNETRVAERTQIHRSLRNQFWWWCKGAGLPSSALEQLACSAELLQCFPEARASLATMLGAPLLERKLPDEKPAPKVIYLSELRARRGRAAEDVDFDEVVGMEMPLCKLLFVEANVGCAVWLRGSDCLQVSFINPPNFVPALCLAGTMRELERINDWTFELNGCEASALGAGGLQLVLESKAEAGDRRPDV